MTSSLWEHYDLWMELDPARTQFCSGLNLIFRWERSSEFTSHIHLVNIWEKSKLSLILASRYGKWQISQPINRALTQPAEGTSPAITVFYVMAQDTFKY